MTYDFWDFLSEIGGVLEIFIFLFGLVLFPFSRHMFVVECLNSLYFARTSENGLLVSSECKRNYNSGEVKKNVRFDFNESDDNKYDTNQHEEDRDLQKKRAIIFSKSQLWMLYIKSWLGIGANKKNKKLCALYDSGIEKLKADFDLVGIMRQLHEQKVLFNFYSSKHSDIMIEINKSKK